MKKFFTILTALMICIALNFGLTNEAQAAEIDSSIEAGGLEVEELYGPPPPPHHDRDRWERDRHRDRWNRDRRYPPPPHRDRWGHDRRYPPPPHRDRWGHDRRYPPPPPPHHGRHDRW